MRKTFLTTFDRGPSRTYQRDATPCEMQATARDELYEVEVITQEMKDMVAISSPDAARVTASDPCCASGANAAADRATGGSSAWKEHADAIHAAGISARCASWRGNTRKLWSPRGYTHLARITDAFKMSRRNRRTS